MSRISISVLAVSLLLSVEAFGQHGLARAWQLATGNWQLGTDSGA